jgi:hypothetical protein
MQADDDSAAGASSGSKRRRWFKAPSSVEFTDIVAALPAALAVGAAAVYGLLIVSYSQFYSELGVRPSEVGLEYGPGLGGIAGIAITLLILVGAATLVAWLLVRRLSGSPIGRRYSKWLVAFLIVYMCLGLVILFSNAANERADQAKNGNPVEPIEILGVELLALRADRARVVLVDPKAEQTQAYGQLKTAREPKDRKKLLYLGRSGGTLVVYEVDRQSVWHLPASSFAVRALNCETTLPGRDPACPD